MLRAKMMISRSQRAFYVFADASRWTDDSYAFAFELLEKACVGVAPGVDFGQAGKRAVRFSVERRDYKRGREEAGRVSEERTGGLGFQARPPRPSGQG
jgi:aspartate/methionine/tyrosine aminotransferase